MASASARSETQALFAMKSSAEAVYRRSSLVIRRTRTLLSTARISLPDVVAKAGFQFAQSFGIGSFRSE